MTDCDECGDRLVDPRDKNLSGWWRDRCLPCIREEHGHALTDEEILGSRPQFRVTIAEADDGQFRAFEEASDSDRSGRGPRRSARTPAKLWPSGLPANSGTGPPPGLKSYRTWNNTDPRLNTRLPRD